MSTPSPEVPATQARDPRFGMPFPGDNRRRETPTTRSPWSANGLVSATFSEGLLEATGFVIGDRYVVTAAHSVYRSDLGGRASGVRFRLAQDADKSPFSVVDAAAWHFPDDYPDEESTELDYCLLVLSQPLPTLARYQLTAAGDETLRNTEYQIAGYPGDKTPDNSMWCGSGRLTKVTQSLLEYRISTYAGQSGAAVSTRDQELPAAVGIHSGVNRDDTANTAVRVTREVIDRIQAWQRG